MIYVILLIVLFAVLIAAATSGNKFRDNSRRIVVGMTENEVVSIMGTPSFTKQHQDGSYEFVYEKGEWKGVFRGGTQTRRMEIVFNSEKRVISIGRNANCDKSGWL